jgi:hypothetical protein
MDAIQAFVRLLGVDLLFVGVVAFALAAIICACDQVYRGYLAWKDLRVLFEDRKFDGPP